MKNERTLSYVKSQKLTKEDLQCVSAANGTVRATSESTYYPPNDDTAFDVQDD